MPDESTTILYVMEGHSPRVVTEDGKVIRNVMNVEFDLNAKWPTMTIRVAVGRIGIQSREPGDA